MKKNFLVKKKKNNPFYSIITVVKNSENNIDRTIRSIIAQKYKNFEHIIVDGKSKDNTIKKILKYKKSLNILLSEKDDGIYFAMNKGLSLAKGKVIVFVNSGDKITKNALKIIKKKFDENKKIDFVFGTVLRHYTKSKILKFGFNESRIKYNFDFATSHSTGFFIKRKAMIKLGKFNTIYKCSADYDLYYKAIIKNKLKGSSTKKNQLIGTVMAGGYSSKVGFLDHIFEETRIRLNNKQNFIFVILLFSNAIVKGILKKIKFF